MSSNINTFGSAMESSVVPVDHGVGAMGFSDRSVLQIGSEALPASATDRSPNFAVHAMRSAQNGLPLEAGVHGMLHGGFGIDDKHGGMGAKPKDAVAIAEGVGAKAVAGGIGASAIAEGPGASAIAEGRGASAVAEGPAAHAVAEGAFAHAVAEDRPKIGLSHPDHALKSDQPIALGRPIEGALKGRELPTSGEVVPGIAVKAIEGHVTK